MFSYRHIHAQTRHLSNCKHSSTMHVCIAQNIGRLYLPIHETNLLINRLNKSFCNETEEIKNNDAQPICNKRRIVRATRFST